jgi:hypothetical protein
MVQDYLPEVVFRMHWTIRSFGIQHRFLDTSGWNCGDGVTGLHHSVNVGLYRDKKNHDKNVVFGEILAQDHELFFGTY